MDRISVIDEISKKMRMRKAFESTDRRIRFYFKTQNNFDKFDVSFNIQQDHGKLLTSL
jgi:hypothetical protein